MDQAITVVKHAKVLVQKQLGVFCPAQTYLMGANVRKKPQRNRRGFFQKPSGIKTALILDLILQTWSWKTVC